MERTLAAPKTYKSIFRTLLRAYGPQHWWPGESPFEIIVGALLNQNTAWTNVVKALDNLKAEGLLDLDSLRHMEEGRLAGLIRPADYFNVKAKRLQNLCRFIAERGGVEALDDYPTDRLRQDLLSVNGVGPETADDILLYAYHRPVFVIDAYTRRLFSRLGLVKGDENYECLHAGFQEVLGQEVEIFNGYHVLIVHHAKYYCNSKPKCETCCLRKSCKNTGI
ncbi:endonuclease III domain-containing protein [Solemya velesiana gill symbiont]|uniref:Endonuclease n=1 Tax=Solemya velesiana gill symbiont TaxID=1918948 RepID=A0A1T2KUI3_9GAMM|nr:endonuclease [Solemya velesiana gill symbiont]OOZ36482.1 endonuclease [Solemya velesiana gill symbiont]